MKSDFGREIGVGQQHLQFSLKAKSQQTSIRNLFKFKIQNIMRYLLFCQFDVVVKVIFGQKSLQFKGYGHLNP